MFTRTLSPLEGPVMGTSSSYHDIAHAATLDLSQLILREMDTHMMTLLFESIFSLKGLILFLLEDVKLVSFILFCVTLLVPTFTRESHPGASRRPVSLSSTLGTLTKWI